MRDVAWLALTLAVLVGAVLTVCSLLGVTL